MNEQDLKNKEIIKTLVNNHFGLSEESFDFFCNELENPTLDDYYQNLIVESGTKDLRIRYDIPKSISANLDEGWKYFKNHFSSFVLFYNFNYEHFTENKIVINKNSIKTRKALINFYTSIQNYIPTFNEILSARVPFDDKDQKKEEIFKTYEKSITEEIDNQLDTVSKKCLPKTTIKLVFSFNFADWFLCSTAEKWRSCLNLESEFRSAFWGGIPGLVGDKNRVMIYITDGTKKQYNGIITDKIIARSWGLIDITNTIHIIKPYPLAELFNSNIVNSITHLHIEEIESKPRFITKHPVKLLHFKAAEQKISAFIYQDMSGFCEDKRIRASSSGYYCFFDDALLKGEPALNFEKGLNYLIEKKQSLTKYLLDLKKCSLCGGRSKSINIVHSRNRETTIQVCDNCLNSRYSRCEDCGEWFEKTDLIKATIDEKEKKVCKECIKSYKACDNCGSLHKNSKKVSFSKYNDLFVCKKCFNEIEDDFNLVKCDCCGDLFAEELTIKNYERISLREYDYIKRCKKCIEILTDDIQPKLFTDDEPAQ